MKPIRKQASAEHFDNNKADDESADGRDAVLRVPALLQPDVVLASLLRSKDAELVFQVGLRFSEGDEVMQDEEAAFECYAHAAALGHDQARLMAAACLIGGVGCTADLAAAAELVDAAEASGTVTAKAIETLRAYARDSQRDAE